MSTGFERSEREADMRRSRLLCKRSCARMMPIVHYRRESRPAYDVLEKWGWIQNSSFSETETAACLQWQKGR